MRKSILFLFALIFTAQFSWAEVEPSTNLQNYYSAASGKTSDALRQALKGIISSHTTVSYGNLGTLMQWSDTENADGKNVVDIYTNCTFTVTGALTWASTGTVGAGMNREHTVPQSWFSEASPMVSDAFHIYPTDCKANNNRSSYLYGEFSGEGTHYSSSSCAESGKLSTGNSNSIASYTYQGQTYSPSYTHSGKVYEPADEYKGDIARGYFYMATCYADKCANWSGGAFGNDNNGLENYTAELMLKWHRLDPVSEKELLRNEVIYGNTKYNKSSLKQGNRNPFIDYPDLVEYIWGNKKNQNVTISSLVSAYDGTSSTDPAITSPTGTIDLGSTNTTVSATYDMTVKGVNLEDGNLTLYISGTNASFFSLTTTTITKAQALSGYNVTITYAPTTEGSHTATLTIIGCGVSNHTVTLTGSCTAEHTITWISNGLTQYTTAATGTVPPLPATTPANCSSSRVFVGWTAQTNVSGTAPTDLFTTPTATINAPKTYYAVYADATTLGSGYTGSVTITTSTTNIPTSYGTANTFTEYTLEGYQFKIQQMYLNGAKLQWRAAGNSSGTGTMYNTSTFPGKLSSIVLTYNSSDNNKNFTLKVGSSPNPTEGTSITPTSSGNVYTFDCSDQNADYFVLTNGSGAGYLDQIVINYSGSSTTYSNYSTECAACTPVTPTASFVSPITSLEEGTTVTNIVTTASNGVVTYSSNNTSVATVDASTGEVTGVAAGTATITASIAATACYNATSASYTITVEAAPEYTVTFINNGATFFSQTGHAGDAISSLGTPSLTDCDDYTFEGWSTSQYVEDNTSSPAIITPTTIPAGGATYYAVYTKSVTEGGSGGGGSSTANVSMESLAAANGTVGNYEFSTAKNNGSTAPTYNTNSKDLRIYAKGSVTISSSTAMTGIVFNLSSQGKKRLAQITADVGTIATQASGDETVIWTGSATSVTFTVGDNADYGSDGSTKAGQLCFSSVDITTGSGSGGTTTTYHTTAPNCSCEVTITITSADETMGTVEFVE